MATVDSATRRLTPARPGLVQLGLVGLLLVLAAIAGSPRATRWKEWTPGPGTDLGTLGFYVTAWVVMMAAMMFPSIWPMVTMYASMQAGGASQGRRPPAGATAVFVGGYLVTWTAAGLVGLRDLRARPVALDRCALLGSRRAVSRRGRDRAAAYQLTPLKDACLSKCRNPLMFLLSAWRPGRIGALRMGIDHGAWCVGCCWALMAALFALGVMSIGWMVFIAALIALEKLLPWKAAANTGSRRCCCRARHPVAFTPRASPA